MSVTIRAGEIETVTAYRAFSTDVHLASSVKVGIGSYTAEPSTWVNPANTAYSTDGKTVTITVTLGNGATLNSTGRVYLWVKLVTASQTLIERLNPDAYEFVSTGGTAPVTARLYVESVSVNGGTPELPDVDGNVDLTVSGGGGGAGVDSFNTRTGVVSLTKADVTGTGLAAADVGADATGTASAAVAAHVAAVDPHPQYLTAAEGGAAYDALGAASTAQAAAIAASQPLDSDLTAIAALSTTAFGRGLLALADAAALRTAAGLGTAATQASTAFDAAGAAAAAQAASQPLDSDLTSIAALTTTSFGRSFLALADAAAGRTLLGLGSLATQSGTFSGTSSGTNTGDQDLSTYAPLASPALTGNPTAPTQTAGNNSTRVATTAYADASSAASVVDSIADADTSHAPSRNAVFDALALKAPLASPTFTGTPAAPTPSAADNSTKLATTAYVDTAAGLLVPKSTIDAKGDLYVGTANDTPSRLAVGSDGQVLTADSAQTTGTKWATPAGGSSGGLGIYGDGSDGAVTFDGTTTVLTLVPSSTVYTLARDIFCTDITINNNVTIKANGFRIYANGTVTGGGANALIHWNATVNANQNGGGGPANTNSSINPAAGGAGANGGGGGGAGAGSAGSNQTGQYSIGGAGGAGGAGSAGAGGAAGTITTPPVALAGHIRSMPLAALGMFMQSSGVTLRSAFGGAGGGGGGGDGGANTGGGGGGGGGVVIVVAKTFAGTGAIQARGSIGITRSTGNPGGGGGGGGGVVIVVSGSVSAGAVSGWTIDANGGAAGSGVGTGVAGSAGSNGTVIMLPN